MKKRMPRILIAALLLGGLFAARPTAARADEPCPTPTPVTLDIRPGNSKNTVKLSSRGTLAVAVLTTDDFDASQFAPEMAHLNDSNTPMAEACAGAQALRWSLDDEDGDGRLDLVFFFRIQDLNFTLNTTSATLMAHGSLAGTETHIEGMDTVRPVP